MITFLLTDECKLPNPSSSGSDIVAIGGNIFPSRLINSYRKGIFPWPSDSTSHNLWFCPQKRFVLFLKDIHVNTSLRKFAKKCQYKVRADTNFIKIIQSCQTIKRKNQPGTWITDELLYSYGHLHKKGLAHSIEVYNETSHLIGGLYGLSLGKAFFGESMFSTEKNASKIAFLYLLQFMKQNNFDFVDAQIHSELLASFGAKHISKQKFLHVLQKALQKNTIKGPWDLESCLNIDFLVSK